MPLALSKTPDDTDVSALHEGLALLDLPSTPQGVTIARVVEACRDDGRPLFRRVGIQVPRRSAKTTSLTAVALGRMKRLPGYRIMSTAQTGKIARGMWLETVFALDAHYADTPEDERPYLARLSNGSECLTWKATGATWRPVTPSPLAYRSQAADLLIFEEAGHIRPEVADALKAGALPTQDTRPLAQAWVVGTPGDARVGLLWDTLEMGRAGRAGIVDYAAGETEDIADEDVWWRVHPGLASGMTTVETIRERFAEMPRALFAAEYAGRWPATGVSVAIDPQLWTAASMPAFELPEHFGVASDAQPDGNAASVAAAWRTPEGHARVALLEYRPGVDWVPGVLVDLRRKYRRVPFAVDRMGANEAVVDRLAARRPPIEVTKPTFGQVQGAIQTLVGNLGAGALGHMAQPALDKAAAGAVWRELQGGRSFHRRRSASDVSPLVACALALWAFDQRPERKRIESVSAAV